MTVIWLNFKNIVLSILLITLFSCKNASLRPVDNNDDLVSINASSKIVCTDHNGEPIDAQDYFTIIDYLNKINHSELTNAYSRLGDALVHNDGLIDEIIDYVPASASTDTKNNLINELANCLLDYAKDYCERVNGEKPTNYICVGELLKLNSNPDCYSGNLQVIKAFKKTLFENPDSIISAYYSSSFSTVDSVLNILPIMNVIDYSNTDYQTIINYFKCENEFGSEGIYYLLGEKLLTSEVFFNELMELTKKQKDDKYRCLILRGIYDSLYSYALMDSDTYLLSFDESINQTMHRLIELRRQLSINHVQPINQNKVL